MFFVVLFVVFDVMVVCFVDDCGCVMGVVIDCWVVVYDVCGFDVVGVMYVMWVCVMYDMVFIV